MDNEELIASGFVARYPDAGDNPQWFVPGFGATRISEVLCWACHEIIKVPPGFYANWWDDSLERVPDHDCMGPRSGEP